MFGSAWIERRELEAQERGKARAGRIEAERWRFHVETASFYDKPLKAITTKMLQQWVRKLRETKATSAIYTGPIGKKVVQRKQRDRVLERSTVANILQLVKLCFDDAMREGLVAVNPAAIVKIGRAAVEQKEGDLISHLSEAEIDSLFALNMPPRELAFFSLAIYGGLRLGELLGLRWGDVDSTRIRVRRSYDKSVKSGSSLRDVPTLPPVIEAVRAYRASLAAAPIGGLMFPSDSGGCHGPSYTMAWTDKSYRKAGKLKTRVGWATKAGIVGKTFHVLRHTCGCHLLMGTWEPWTGPLELKHVSAWLGHSSEQVTREHYAQFARDSLTNRVQQVLMARPRREQDGV